MSRRCANYNKHVLSVCQRTYGERIAGKPCAAGAGPGDIIGERLGQTTAACKRSAGYAVLKFLKRADGARYQAREAGCDLIAYFDSTPLNERLCPGPTLAVTPEQTHQRLDAGAVHKDGKRHRDQGELDQLQREVLGESMPDGIHQVVQ